MARRRGFFAEIQHQQRLADQRYAAAQRQAAAAHRRSEAAHRAAVAAHQRAVRASEADRKRLEREAAQAHAEARQAEVDDMNADLNDRYAQLDEILSATLDVDDYVDLETLRQLAEHPPFDREDLREKTPLPAPIPEPAVPVRAAPAPVTGLFKRKEKEAAALAAVEQKYAADYAAWQTSMASLPARREAQAAEHAARENARIAALKVETQRYAAESAAREAEVASHNADLDELIAGLAYGTVEAVQDYVGIVLANSVYPEWFPVTHKAEFDPSGAELRLQVTIPGPDQVPSLKGFKYVKSTDEITSQPSIQKDVKERYAAIVENVTLRSLHEIFEADRRGVIRAISLELGTDTVNPATGRALSVQFVAVATSRERFDELDLGAVVPSATLAHLGATVSKNPHGLVAISSSGVRRA